MKGKAVSGMLLILLFMGMLALALRIHPVRVWASVPPDYAWIHGHVYKNITSDLPLRGILLELWDNSSNTFLMNTTSADSDVDPGVFDFGNIYTGLSRTFFVRMVVKGYNNTGFNMLDVVNQTTGTPLIYYDTIAFTCTSGQDYYSEIRGPDEGDPTTLADTAITIYYYTLLVYDYFRKHLNHFIEHVTARIIVGYQGAGAGSHDMAFGDAIGEYIAHGIGHEYAHCIMFQTYSPWLYCNSTQGHSGNHADRRAWGTCHHVLADPDFGNDAYPVPCSGDALSEGWANFVPWIVYGAYNYTYGPEAFGWWLDRREGAGEKNEFGFMAILHDICYIPGQDQITMMRYVWEVFSEDHPGAVNMFYEDFVTSHPELADDVKIAYMRRFAVFSRLGIEVNATENGYSLHVNVSGYLMPFPHSNKTVTINYRLVEDTIWSWLANLTTNNSSFYSVTADLPMGEYEFQSLWSGDRDHHTGHHGSVSDTVRTGEYYIGSVNGVRFYSDKSVYHLGDTVQIKIVNANYTTKTIEHCLSGGHPWPIYYNFSYADLELQIFDLYGSLALNESVLVPPFYGTTYVDFTNITKAGIYTIKVFNDVVGSIYIEALSSPAVGGIYIPVNKLELAAPYVGLTILLAVAAATVVYINKRKRNRD